MNLKFKTLIVGITLQLILNGCNVNTKQNTTDIPSFDWIETSEPIDFSWVKEVGAKSFPNQRIVNANKFGAANDTTVLSTRAIQAAIDECHKSGGGTVTLNAGHYTVGALFVKKGVNLEIGKDVTLYASTDINDYPELRTRVAGIEMIWPSAVLNIIDTDHAAISGEGLIDCRGEVFWNKYRNMRKEYEKEGLRWIVDYDCKRVRGILVSNSTNVTLKNFTIMRTGFWGIQILYSQYCTVDGITVNNNIGGHGPSTDGIDIDSSSSILVENCYIDCNDDNICLKAGRDADGLRVNRPTENIVIRGCSTGSGSGLVTCGSETSGGIRNVLAYNLKANKTPTVLLIKSALTRGGFVENIYMTDVVSDSARRIISADLNWYPAYSYSQLPDKYEGQEVPEHWTTMLTQVEPERKGHPRIRNIFLANVKATRAQLFITTSGLNETLRLDNFQLHSLDVEARKGGNITWSNNFILKNIQLKTEDNDRIISENNTNLHLDVQYQ